VTDQTDARDDQIEIVDDGPVIRAKVQLGDCPPDRAIAAFTDPALLASWWGGELTINPEVGGVYNVWFPKVPASLVGKVVRYAPGDAFEFSWAWEHEPDSPERTVIVTASSNGQGTELAIVHGPHGTDEAEETARAAHRDGWEYFLPRLHAAMAS
jgi:uncharacterized protein YndB with AHSA1/START domain